MTVVDATKELLVNVLEYRPFLVKPNHHELGEIFGVELADREAVVPYAEKLKKMGAENVLVSMAGEGAVLAAGDGKFYKAPAPAGKLVNGVGAGDSMVAGFLAGWSGRTTDMPFIWEWPPGAPARSRNCWRPERKSWPYTGSWPPGSPVAPAARRQTDSGQGRQISGGAEHGSIYWKKRIRRNCHRQNPGVWQGGKTGKAREDTGSGSGNEPLPEGHGDGPGTAGRAVREGLTGSGGSRCGHI